MRSIDKSPAADPMQEKIQQAFQATGIILRLLGENFRHLGRGADREAETAQATQERLDLLFRHHELIRRTSEMIGGLEGCDEDAADEINREFRRLKECLEAAGMLGTVSAGPLDEGW